MATRARDGGAATAMGERYLELVRRHPLVEILTEDELDRAIAMIHSLGGIRDPETDAYRVTLAILIERYEDDRYPIGGKSSPADMVRFLMESNGVDHAQMAVETGLPSATLAEITAGRHEISEPERRAMAEYFAVDPGVFA